MVTEVVRALKARGWMKRNMPFLYTWHAYVGYEMNLYEAFKKPKTVEEVATKYSLEKDLLKRWLDVGLAISYVKEGRKGKYKTARKLMLPSSKKNPRSTGAILKEMMELHIPTLLSYPTIMKTGEKNVFDGDKHGAVVAQTSSMLETLALPKMTSLVKKYDVKEVVDVGCGYGGYVQKLSKAFPHLTFNGLEVNEEVTEEAKKQCSEHDQITIECTDVFEWTPDEKNVDLVLVHNLLHYLSDEERINLFSHISKWLQKGGVISIITPIQNGKHGKQFSSVFNSFFSAFENLHSLPTKKDIEKVTKATGLKLASYKPIIKEAGWYHLTLEK
ncbi:class I SAM-dependent methyltransferase [Metabacillus sp. HB246100]